MRARIGVSSREFDSLRDWLSWVPELRGHVGVADVMAGSEDVITLLAQELASLQAEHISMVDGRQATVFVEIDHDDRLEPGTFQLSSDAIDAG